MSMTREEAIEIFEQKGWWIAQKETLTSKQAEEIIKLNNAVNFALSALHPVSRERVEKMRGEWTTDGVCSRCGFDAMYYKGVPVQVRTNYCPTCGSPMTDEAVETIMKRMEEMRND